MGVIKEVLKNITRTIVLAFVVIYLCAFVLLRIPAVQSFLASNVAEALSEKLGTKVLVGNIDVRLPNQIIVDDLLVYDQQKEKMLRVARLSAAIELLPLFDGEISISSAQLFGMKANLYKKDAVSPINCQFVIDSLSSKDTTNQTPLNLNIASLVIRNGIINYDQYDKPLTSGKFSPYHVGISNLSSHVILYKLTDDSLNLAINRLSLDEKSGIHLKSFTSKIVKTPNRITIDDFSMAFPDSRVNIPYLNLTYEMQGDSINPESINYKASIFAERINPEELTPFVDTKILSAIPVVDLKASSEGNSKALKATLSVNALKGNSLALETSGNVYNVLNNPSFNVQLSKCKISQNLISALTSNFSLPQQLARLGNIDMRGRARAVSKDNIDGNLDIFASNVGKAKLIAKYNRNQAKVHIETPSLNIAQVVDNKGLGTLKCNLDAEAKTSNGKALSDVKSIREINGKVKGVIGEITYNDYTYRDINIDADLNDNVVKGRVGIQDPNIQLTANGAASFGKVKSVDASVSLKEFAPKTLHLTDAFGKSVLNVSADANMKGTNLDNMLGTLNIHDVSIIDNANSSKNAYLQELTLISHKLETGEKEVVLNSDIADVNMRGNITLSEIPQSFTNILAQELPSLPGIPKIKQSHNNFAVSARVKDLTFVKRFMNIPVEMPEDVILDGYINSQGNSTDLSLNAPQLNISGIDLQNTLLHIWTPEGTVQSSLTTFLKQKRNTVSLALDCKGDDNNLYTSLTWDNMRSNVFRGTLNTVSQFYTDLSGKNAIKLNIPHSSFEIGDTLWQIHSQGIEYADSKLSVDHFAVENNNQHVYVDGIVSKNTSDSIIAELKNINVEYIMNLIDFHSVDFAGFASGKAVGFGVLGDLKANAHLDVSNFLFEQGHMGTLHADAKYSNATESIDIDAVADDSEANARTLINGAISPQRNTIDLDIKPENTRLEFMQSMCSSFLRDVDLRGSGRVRLAGYLNAINLTGSLYASGDVTISSTSCRYTMPGDSITFVPNDIRFNGCPLIDKFGNTAYLSGGVHHRNLGRISFDLTAETPKFLAYDFPRLNGSTFCGHAIIDGSIGLHGKGNEVNITADCTTLDGTYMVYDASSPDAIKSQDFITWGSINKPKENADSTEVVTGKKTDNSGNDRTNIRMRFMVNATPNAKLHLIMDQITGDYIDLYGTGALRVNYYNKGSMEIFGNYAIDHGTYKMTIQSILRRDFEFQKGGTIAFGGDPYNAMLNMQAAYSLNSVSLADLNIGSSFKANNVPVKCLMDISGTPGKPNVSFNLDLPSLSSDARQMVYSIINSEEEMNQQVLYLLAIGRFYSQQNNTNNSAERVGQTTLAMQSFLSGTLSQQLNNMLNQAIGSNKWSIGANITPGADGFSNAEYEGLLSGKLFNNRLLFNGQFGYRDNITTNSQNFIGDFSLQYLLTPNGNLSLKMYNQANDRYFTRNSLNTQGIGIVIQKEFGK